MYYCEKCKNVNEKKNCVYCGKRKLREVNDDDLCFFVELGNFHATMFLEALSSQRIDAFSIPSGFSLTTRANSSQKIYIPYKSLAARPRCLRLHVRLILSEKANLHKRHIGKTNVLS